MHALRYNDARTVPKCTSLVALPCTILMPPSCALNVAKPLRPLLPLAAAASPSCVAPAPTCDLAGRPGLLYTLYSQCSTVSKCVEA